VVIFGTTGMVDVTDVYEVLNQKINDCRKPVFPVLPSIVLAAKEMERFKSHGRAYFTDESALGKAIAKVYNRPKPASDFISPAIDAEAVRNVIDNVQNGYLTPIEVQVLLDSAGINRAKEEIANSEVEIIICASKLNFPLVMKVVGPVHKSDVGGVALNITSVSQLRETFRKMMEIEGAVAVMLQEMLSGTELFAGVNFEPKVGHVILCGLGGVFIEVIKDISSGLSPLNKDSAHDMIRSLIGYKIFAGVRGKEGISEEIFADIIVRISALLQVAPEIREMDMNPLLGRIDSITAVDARIRIEK
ncbi:MAG: acetate--CoA ligase family protein, partial [Ignavibacteria bacterium]|nr:acetate--CoA ligase family protein [Ignavibacteria bacterium]